jgi:Arc/MetJ-type ribon-helix-helix transcriptional regulator
MSGSAKLKAVVTGGCGFIGSHIANEQRKIAITLEASAIGELDRLVDERVYKNRSQAIQMAIDEKLHRIKQTRLIEECSKLDQAAERAFSEEGLTEAVGRWPAY